MKADALAERRVHVMQGEYCVSDDRNVILTTILGSCVAACMRDPEAQVGGMNHFLLPGTDDRSQSCAAESYGVHLMELLVNDLLRHGARRERLEAKLFGGSATMQGLCDIFAMRALSMPAAAWAAIVAAASSSGRLPGAPGRSR
jgi:chemotaxis protein CheD